MPVSYRRLNANKFQALILAAVLLLCVPAAAGRAEDTDWGERRKTIVLDPGHGGHDIGAKGAGGTLEKTVTLFLARRLAAELSSTYQVVLTRKDDYSLEISERTAVANHHRADVFISLHTGGAFLHQVRGVTIFYYRNWDAATAKVVPGAALARKDKTNESPLLWENLQLRHVPDGKRLAKAIKAGLEEQVTDVKINMQQAPAAILKSADMPAVLIEVGYLTNPTQERALRDPNILAAYGIGIANGIKAFLKNIR